MQQLIQLEAEQKIGAAQNDAAAVRLAGAVLPEIANAWAVERHFFSQASMQRLVNLAGLLWPTAPV